MIRINEVMDYAKDRYPFIGKIRSVRNLQHNNFNSNNYIIQSQKGMYVLRNFIDYSKPEKIETICRILRFCKRYGAKVPEPIKNKTGKYVDVRKKIYLTKYYVGHHYTGKDIEIKEMAKNLAILHRALGKNTISYSYRPDISRYYSILTPAEIEKIRKIITNTKLSTKFDRIVSSNIKYLLECVINDKKTSTKISKLNFEKQLIHCDLHPENAIFNNHKLVTIIDFNDLRYDKQIKDVAFACFRFALYKTNNIKKIKRRIKLFVETYKIYYNFDYSELYYLTYFFQHDILRRLSYILRKKYFHNSDMWFEKFEENFRLLKLSKKVLQVLH